MRLRAVPGGSAAGRYGDDPVWRWMGDAVEEETSRATYEWFAARTRWPPEELLAGWTREWKSVRARVACRVVGRARRDLGAEGAAEVLSALRPRCGPVPRLVWLGTPMVLTCGCELPRHVRGIARCEWNEVRGFRPRPVAAGGEK